MSISKDFIYHVRCHLEEYNFKLILANSLQVNTGTGYRVTGIFDESRRLIRVAKKSANWFPTLVHEYSHFLEYLDSTNTQLAKEDKALHIVEQYVSGDICHSQSVISAFRTVAHMEWKCDRRAVGLIQKWNLPINTTTYIREANLYVYLYHLYCKYRTFNAKEPSPYLLRRMPATFRVRSYEGVPAGVEKSLGKLFEGDE